MPRRNRLKKLVLLFLIIGSIIAAALLFSSRNYLPSSEASYIHNNNIGFFLVDFLDNEEGIVSASDPLRDNIEIDTLTGTAMIEDQNLPDPLLPAGYFTTANVQPSSFQQWNSVELKANYSQADDISVTIYDCQSTPAVIPGFDNQPLIGGRVNISTIDPSTYSCLRVRVNLEKNGAISPQVSEVKATWTPLPVLLVGIDGDTAVQSGNGIQYSIRYSVSYADDNGVVVWAELPQEDRGSITNFTPSYNQKIEPVFVSASGSGQYTDTGTTVQGIAIPENSVYWDLGYVTSGTTGILHFVIASENGLENGITYSLLAHTDSQSSEAKTSDNDYLTPGNQPFSTVVGSTPAPVIEKDSPQIIHLNGSNYIGAVPPIVTYELRVRNTYSTRGRETLFNPIITDDVSNIFTQLQTVCSESSPENRFTINNGGSLDTLSQSISWDLANDLDPGETDAVTYIVDYTGCPEGTVVNNDSELTSDKSTPVTDDLEIQIGVVTTIYPREMFAKGDRVDGYASINVLNDDHPLTTQPFGDVFSYLLSTINRNTVRVDDLIMIDKIPDGVEFVAATLPSSVQGTIFYSTAGAANAPDNPPSFDYTLAPRGLGPSWTTAVPSDPSLVEWVAFYVPCLNSLYFSGPSNPAENACLGRPSSATGEIQVRIPTPGDVCSYYSTNNTGNFYVFEASNSINNSDSDVSPLSSPVEFQDDNEATHVTPGLADIESRSSISGPVLLSSLESGEYIIRVENTGDDTIYDTSLTIDIPQLMVNGLPQYIDLMSVTGGIVDFSGLPSQVEIDLDNITPDSYKEVRVVLRTPSGIEINDSFTLIGRISGSDDDDCQEIAATVSQVTKLEALPNLFIYKDRDEAIINSGEEIHYSIYYSNTGDAPSKRTYIVDRVPYKTSFRQAYTSGTDSNGNTYTCENCTVLFASFDSGLPSDNSASQPFYPSTIDQNFTPGTETSPGVWSSPFGDNTMYVAWLVDDQSLANPLFGAGESGTVGMTVANDEDGPGPETSGSPVGTVIYNYATILSQNLLQAIGNQITTTILPDPGLRISKESSKEYVHTQETFDWNIDYFNDSGNDDTEVTLTDTLPYGIELLNVYHSWNDVALSNGASPSGEQDVSGNPNLTITHNTNGTTTIEIDISQGLREENLHTLEGGTVRLEVRPIPGLQTSTLLLNHVLGCFANSSNRFCINEQDPVVIENPDLWIRKLVDLEEPIAGEDITYTLLISNEGIHDAPNVVINDTLPAGLCYLSGSTGILPSTWSISEPDVVGACGEEQNLTWDSTISQTGLPAGTIPGRSEDIYLTYSAHVDDAAEPGTQFTNASTISTSIPEDPYYPNTADVDIRTPYPDPYVLKYAPSLVLPDYTFDYTILYGNDSRETAQGVYLIDTLPDYDSDETPDLELISINGTHGETFYFHDDPIDGTPPIFDYSDPLTNGWTDDPSSINVSHIAIAVGSLGELEGPHTITITVQTVDPDTGEKLPAGITFTNFVEIFSETVDDDETNNTASDDSRIPGLDLAIRKTGSAEGSFPGVPPGKEITYTIRFENTGTEDACAVYITDTLPDEIIPVGILSDFTELRLYDSEGLDVFPVDTGGLTISSPVEITFMENGDGTYSWYLGSTETTPYTDVCLPPGTHGEFEIYTEVTYDIHEDTEVTNLVEISEDSEGEENTLENNTDTSTVSVYLPDVTIEKEGASCGVDDICGNEDDDQIDANPGESIRYRLEYDNKGNIDAENVQIEETIPTNTCYKPGSVELNLPAATTVQYSNDNGITWFYTPVAGINGEDCNVTNFRILFEGDLPYPASYWGQSVDEDFTTNSNNHIVAENDQLRLDKDIEISFTQLPTDLHPGCYAQAVASDPNDPNQVYIGCDGHIFKSSDGGLNWSDITGDFPKNLNIYTMIVIPEAPTNPTKRILIGASGNLYYSENEGKTWIFVRSDFTQAWNFDFNVNDPSLVLLAVWGRIYRSSDGGITWNRSSISNLRNVMFNNSNPNYAVAGIDATGSSRVLWSSDGGYNWVSSANSGLPSRQVLGIAYDPADIDTAYAAVYQNGVYRTTDHGATWTRVLSSSYVTHLDCDVSQGGVIYAGTGSRLYSSTDYGGSWTTDSQYLWSAPYQNYAFKASDGVTGNIIKASREDYTDPYRVSTDYGSTFSAAGNNGLEGHGYSQLVISQQDSNLVYATATQGSVIYKSEDGGFTFDPLENSPFSGTMVLDPTDDDRLYIYNYGDGVYLTEDGGFTWTAKNTGLPDNEIRGLGICDDNPDVLYATNNADGVYRTDNGGDNWYITAASFPFNTSYLYFPIEVDPTDEDRLYVPIYNDGVYRSRDGGVTWAEAYSDSYVQGVEISPVDPEVVYIWYNSNYFRRSDNGGDSSSEFTYYRYLYSMKGVVAAYDDPHHIYIVYGLSSNSNAAHRLYESLNGGSYLVPARNAELGTDYPISHAGLQLPALTQADPDAMLVPDSYGGIMTVGYIDSGTSSPNHFVDPFILYPEATRLISWNQLLVDAEIPEGTRITVDILDYYIHGIPHYQDLLVDETGRINISGIDPVRNSRIYPRVTLEGTDFATPILNNWYITFYVDANSSFTFDVYVPEPEGAADSNTIDNTASISTTSVETNYENNTDSYNMNLVLADLAVEKSVDMSAISRVEVNAGTEITYTLSYTNNGPREAEGSVLDDLLPYGATVSTIDDSGSSHFICGAYDLDTRIICNSDGTITGSGVTIPPGEAGTIIITVTVDGAMVADEDLMTNMTEISAETYDPDTSNNRDSAVTILGEYANVWIEKDGDSFANIGRELHYTINYGNNGNEIAEDVVLTDTLDPYVEFISVTQTGGATTLACSQTSPSEFECIPDGGELLVGESGTLEVVVLVNDNTDLLIFETILENYVEITTSTPQTNLLDDSDNHLTPVVSRELAAIAGKVFYDFDEDVLFDEGEDIPLSGIQLYLYGYDIYGDAFGPDPESDQYTTIIEELLPTLIAEGIVPPATTAEEVSGLENYNIVSPETTDLAGDYSFVGLSPGTYNVKEVHPVQYISTGSNGGFLGYDFSGNPIITPSKDGYGSVETGLEEDVNTIQRIIISEGDFSIENNFGEEGGLTGNQVFFDVDANGIYEPNTGEEVTDIPIAGIEVTLYQDADEDQELDPEDPILAVTQTDEFGHYYFAGLEIDDTSGDNDYDYILAITDSAGYLDDYENTRGAFGVNDNSQDATGYQVILSAGNPVDLTADFGFYNEEAAGELIETGKSITRQLIIGFAILSIISYYSIRKSYKWTKQK